MIKTTIRVEGMACTMCEAHVNDAVRKAFAVEKVSSSRAKGETTVISAEALPEEALKRAIEAAGYGYKGSVTAPAKKGLLGWK